MRKDAMPTIEFNNVYYDYVVADGVYRALEGVDLEVNDGEFVCLVGHSGCGKSTMLNLIAGLAQPTAGEVLIDGERVGGPGPDRSIVFQSYSLFPWQTALGNVSFALRRTHREMGKLEARERAMTLLDQVGIAEAAARYPFQLSGGMRQRVAIARALAVDAPVMLLDEPFGALDPLIRRKLQRLLIDLWGAGCCKTAVFVTHDIDEALTLADRIVFMEPRRIVREFALPCDRSRDVDEWRDDPRMRQIKSEVLALFEASASEGGDEE